MLQRCWIAAVLFLVVAGSRVHGQTQLEWKFKEGDKFYLETVSSFKQGMKSLGKELRQDFEMTFLFSVIVEKTNPDRSAVLEEKLEGIFVRATTTPAAAIPAEDKFNQQLRGVTFRLTVTLKGEVTRFEGYEDLVKRIAGEDAEARKTVQAVLSEDYMKRSATEVLGVLPPGPVKKDETWGGDKKYEIPLGPLGGFSVTRRFTSEGKSDQEGKVLEKITFSGSATYNAPKQSEGGPFPFKVTKGDLKMDDLKGTIWFDAAAGRLAQMEATMHLKGTMKVLVSGNEVETELDQERSTKTRLLDKPPQ
jgi:hypothetical protein